MAISFTAMKPKARAWIYQTKVSIGLGIAPTDTKV
jgi:hypothetical protein